jgi:RNA polymerase sigma-70 factor (ECF subfamily)
MSQAERRDHYAEAIELHRDELRAHCRRILRSPHDAEDALQEALLRAWRSLPQFEGRGSLRSWLYQIATNASLDQMRSREDQLTIGEPAERVEPHDHFERRESAERLMGAVGALTRGQQEVFVLRDVLGMSARETADVRDTTVASVNSSLQRARASLRRSLDATRSSNGSSS